jgi:epidermal growth factor receptor substrate 15
MLSVLHFQFKKYRAIKKYVYLFMWVYLLNLSGFVNDLTLDAKNVSVSSKPKSASVHNEQVYSDDNSTHDSYANEKPGNSFGTSEPVFESESAYSHSEDELARSPHDSPAGRTALESPSQDFSDVHYGKGSEADAETHRYRC